MASSSLKKLLYLIALLTSVLLPNYAFANGGDGGDTLVGGAGGIDSVSGTGGAGTAGVVDGNGGGGGGIVRHPAWFYMPQHY